MNEDNVLAWLHILAAFWYVSGLTAVQICLVRSWQNADVGVKADSLDEAFHFQGVLLVPGTIASGATGIFLWALDYNLLTTGWLLLLEALYVVTLLVCLPMIGVGLRRARLAAFQARKQGRTSAELEHAMADSVPLVFAGIATMLVPAMTFLAVFRPF